MNLRYSMTNINSFRRCLPEKPTKSTDHSTFLQQLKLIGIMLKKFGDLIEYEISYHNTQNTAPRSKLESTLSLFNSVHISRAYLFRIYFSRLLTCQLHPDLLSSLFLLKFSCRIVWCIFSFLVIVVIKLTDYRSGGDNR